MSDLIRRSDAIKEIRKCKFESDMPADWYDGMETAQDIVDEVPSAEANLTCKTCADRATCIMAEPDGNWKACKDYRPYAEAVPLKQTDILIIAVALRYLAQDTERHLTDRTRADALRQQFLKYGASMCKGGDAE